MYFRRFVPTGHVIAGPDLHRAGQGRTQGGFWGFKPPPIGPSTKMHYKEKITFLALLSLFFLQ